MKRVFDTTLSSASAHLGVLFLRIGGAAMILTHGWPKLMKVLSGDFQFGDPIGIGAAPSLVLAAFAEGICSVLVLFGIATRLAAIPLIITMAVAFFIVHADDPFGRKELPLLYMVVFITLLLTGSGRYSVDESLSKRYK